MIATTYIQMFKAGVLLVIVAGLDPGHDLQDRLESRRPPDPCPPGPGQARRHPLQQGTSVSLENISLSLGLVLGFMGLPHVVLRFMTVRNAKAARDSARLAMWIFCVFFLVLVILGYAAVNEVGAGAIPKPIQRGTSPRRSSPGWWVGSCCSRWSPAS